MTTMQTISEIRHKRLEMLITQHGSIANLNDAIGNARTDATLSQIRTRAKHSKTGAPRSMGDDLARKIETSLSLPTGWMDQPVNTKATHQANEPKAEYNAINIESALGTLENFLSKMDSEGRKEAAALLSMFAIGLRPTTKQDLVALLEQGNMDARKAA